MRLNEMQRTVISRFLLINMKCLSVPEQMADAHAAPLEQSIFPTTYARSSVSDAGKNESKALFIQKCTIYGVTVLSSREVD